MSPAPPTPEPRRVLGIDPGLNTTGYAVLEATDNGPRVCEAGVVRAAVGDDVGHRAEDVLGEDRAGPAVQPEGACDAAHGEQR